MFIDVHCHLDSLEDSEKVIERARKARVELIVTQGTNAQTNAKSLELSKKYSEVLCALGLYPIESLKLSTREIDALIDEIRAHKKTISAIGEVGLDLKETSELKKQKETFEKFVDLSLELDKPIIVHSRKAELECIEILETKGVKKVIMHCFSGKLSLAKRIADNGWHLSIPTSVKNSEHFQKVIAQTPVEQLLCETDSPYLHPDREFPNEPANVVVSYQKIAEIKGMSLKEVERVLESNFKKLFGINR